MHTSWSLGLKERCARPGRQIVWSTIVVHEVGGTAFRPRGTPLALVVVALL
jgi:hypothetical protein